MASPSQPKPGQGGGQKPGTAPSSVNRPKPHDPMVRGNGVIERLERKIIEK